MSRGLSSPAAPALAGAARAVEAVISDGHTADEGLDAAVHSRERAAIRAIALGTVRWYLRLAPALDRLLVQPRRVAAPVRALLTCAAHQIEYSRNAAEPTVNAAVDAVRLLGHPGAAGLVNAVLRRFVRERGALFARLDRTLATRTAHPTWLVERLQQCVAERDPAAARRRQRAPADDAARGPARAPACRCTSPACGKPILVRRRYSGCHPV